MNTLIIEIGNNTIRAAVRQGNTIRLVPIGSYDSPYSIPSVCTKLPDGTFVWGDMARLWKFHNGCFSYSIIDLEKQSAYETAISSLISLLLKYTSEVSAIVYVIPAYWSAMEPKKDFLKNAAITNGIKNANFIASPIAFYNKVANLTDKEYSLFYDAGYKGATISLLQRHGNEIRIIDSLLIEDAGGHNYDRLLLSKINDLSILSIENLGHQTLYASNLERKATFVKEYLSLHGDCQIPVDNDGRIFEMSNGKLHTLIAPSLGKSFQLMGQMLQDNHIKEELLKKVYVSGGSCKIPGLIDDLTTYFKTQINENVQIITQSTDDRFIALYGAPTMANVGFNNLGSGTVIKF